MRQCHSVQMAYLIVKILAFLPIKILLIRLLEHARWYYSRLIRLLEHITQGITQDIYHIKVSQHYDLNNYRIIIWNITGKNITNHMLKVQFMTNDLTAALIFAAISTVYTHHWLCNVLYMYLCYYYNFSTIFCAPVFNIQFVYDAFLP
jgi:hypothetical protein